MDFEIEVSAPAPRPALAIRTRTPVTAIGQAMAQAFGTVYQYMLEIGAKPGECAFSAYYNMDMNDLDVDIGFVLAEPAPGWGEIHAMEIPGGQQVSCMYTGPYNQMEAAYTAMTEWMAANGCTPTGHAYEFYYNDPSQVPPSELLTKIMFPLQG